jgi:hypothetical protein
MTGAELRELRHGKRMSALEFGRWLGYKGQPENISTTIRRYERRALLPATVEQRVRSTLAANEQTRHIAARS